MTGWAVQPGGATPAIRGVRLLPVGSSAVLVEPTDARGVVGLYLRLLAARPVGVTDLVPAAATVLVMFDPRGTSRAVVTTWIEGVVAESLDEQGQGQLVGGGGDLVDAGLDGGPGRGAGPANQRGDGGEQRRHEVGEQPHPVVVELPVRYDGPDLAVVAELSGASVDEVIAAHLDQLWTAAFIGFAPGFAYLTGEDDRLTVPRRETPRAIVPAGSVALAAGYCGVYPRQSPGGWHLIGSTDAVLWDARRAEPALLAPGTRVRFVRER